MADERKGISQIERIPSVKDEVVVTQSVQNLSGDHHGAGDVQSTSTQDDYLRQALLRYLAEEASSSESTTSRSFQDYVSGTTTESAVATVAAEDLSSQLQQNEAIYKSTASDPPTVHPTSTAQNGEDKEQNIIIDSPATLKMPPSDSRQKSRIRDVDLEDDSSEDLREHGIFNSTEEEERYLEEFQKAVGPQSAMHDKRLQATAGNDYQNDNPQPRRRTVPANMATLEDSRSDTDFTMSQSLNSRNTPRHILMPPPSRPVFQSQPAPRAQRYSYSMSPSADPGLTLPMSSASIIPVAKALPANIDITNHSTIRNVLDNTTTIDLTEPRLTNRCRGMEYIPFRTKEELDQRRNNHIGSLKDLVIRLHAAIARRLQATHGNDPRISTIGRALYKRATEALKVLFPGEHQHFQDVDTGNYQASQLIILNRLLRRIDLIIRPNGPIHLETSLASWYVAALKWQIDIHEEWITELESGKKRKRDGIEHGERMGADNDDPSDTKDGAEDVKAQKGVGRNRANSNQPRRPGRPPGSLNKSTIAAQLRGLSKERKKRKSSLPPLSRDDVQMAQASAAKYAKHSISGLNSYAPDFAPISQPQIQFQQRLHRQQQLPQSRPRQVFQQQYPHPKYQVPPHIHPQRRFTDSSISPYHQSQESQNPYSMLPGQEMLRSVSNPHHSADYQHHPQTLPPRQSQPHINDHMALHSSLWSSQSLDPQNVDPAILHQHSQLPLSQEVMSGPNGTAGLLSDASVDFHPSLDDLWNGARFEDEELGEEEEGANGS